ncbi:hypothetical protein TWF569_010293 [Orbilia oligospora]|nr:hypothetical protein TWF569_010293 [Orbilia oligospora]
MPQSDFSEWHILRTLGWLLDGRLAKHYPLSRPPRNKRKGTKLARWCTLFEISFRQTLLLIKSDFGMLENFESCQDNYSEAVIKLLDLLVNEKCIATSEGPFSDPSVYMYMYSQPEHKYPRLHRLVQFLKANQQSFDHGA